MIQKNKNTPIILISIILLLLLVILGYVLFFSRGSNSFTGTVEAVEDCRKAIGSSRCTWIIDGNRVSWRWGSALENQKTGNVDIPLDKSAIGMEVEVVGTKIGSRKYTVYKESESIKVIK